MNNTVDIFLAHAEDDEALLQEILTHLAPLRREGTANLWHRGMVGIGEEKQTRIEEKLNAAQVLLLLVSPPFLDSEWHILEKASARRSDGVRLVPVILRDCDWGSTKLGELQALPTDGQAIVGQLNRDAAWKGVVEGLRQVLKECGATSTAPTTDPLGRWFQMVATDCQEMDDGFERPVALRQLEEAWVQVKVQRSIDIDPTQSKEAPSLHQPTTLSNIVQLPLGEPAWNQGHWLLEGPPGSGKTTLLRHLARRLAKEGSPRLIPVFISLPRLMEAGQDWLTHITEGLLLIGETGIRDALTAAGGQGHLVLLLDSLDEVPRERRANLRRWLGLLRRDFSSCRFVVSSRPLGRDDSLDDLPRLDLLALDEKRRQEFLETWFRHGNQDDWKSQAGAALTHLAASRRLWDLSGIPLYLTLLAVLWQKGVKPSENLADLYDEIFDLLLSGRHKRGARPMPIRDHVREALAHLASGMTVDEHWSEPLKNLEARLRSDNLKNLRQRLAGEPAWRDLFTFLGDVYERTQILGPHDRRNGEWRFWHRTFREALTAEHLHRQYTQEGDGTEALVDWAGKLKEGGEGRWAEPLALLASRLDHADDLILRLAEVNPRLTLRAAALAQGLKLETVQKTLRLTEKLKLKERAEVFEGIPDQLGDADACLALVERLKEGCRSGFDLFWLWWIVEEVERRWRPGSRAQDLLDHFFDHIPRPENPDLLWTLETLRDGSVSLWREIPAGEGQVGSPNGEEGRNDDERPVHRVEIVQPYWLGAAPVTNAQYALFDPDKTFHKWNGVPADELATHPRVDINWYEAVSFCRWLATQPGFEGTEPRLPVEEEWEIACRAGTASRFSAGDGEEHLDAMGWYDGNSGSRTHRVGQKLANEWRLYDMHGNVWEWTASPQDWERYDNRPTNSVWRLDPSTLAADLAGPPRAVRVLRGGGYGLSARWCRSAYRVIGSPGIVFGGRGFRVLLSSAPSRPSSLEL